MRKSASNANRGHGSQNLPAVKPDAVSRGIPQLSELELIGADTNLVDEDGNPVPYFDVDLLSHCSEGYCVCWCGHYGVHG